MRYALLIHETPEMYDVLSDGEKHAIRAEYLELSRDPRVLGGERLAPVATATSLRVRGGETLIADGPFADTKEVFGGFFLLDAADLDGALEIAARMPAARMGG
ncbi:MAG: hypothetical protein QOG77_233, partial [Solirubrobacteraceae bacterium]|nr:hypothetical protein [Solirubrobacteraceae bacterium]